MVRSVSHLESNARRGTNCGRCHGRAVLPGGGQQRSATSGGPRGYARQRTRIHVCSRVRFRWSCDFPQFQKARVKGTWRLIETEKRGIPFASLDLIIQAQETILSRYPRTRGAAILAASKRTKRFSLALVRPQENAGSRFLSIFLMWKSIHTLLCQITCTASWLSIRSFQT